MELGFAVKILGPDGRGMKTHDARRPQNAPNLGVSLHYCTEALDWLERCGIRMWRLSSDLAPFATHPERPQFHDQTTRYAAELQMFGEEIRARGIRTSLHPSQYILLSSPSDEVTARSVADLIIQAELLDGMGAGPEAVIILHVGGKYDDPDAAAARVVARIGELPEAVRRRLVLENDDRVWSAPEALAVCQAAGVPMVFDFHHHRCLNPEGIDARVMCAQALATWPDGVRPKVHLSTGRDRADDRAHAEGIADRDWIECAEVLEAIGIDCDVMIEAKAKEHAVLDLAARIHAGTLPRPTMLTHLPAWPEDAGPPPTVDYGAG